MHSGELDTHCDHQFAAPVGKMSLQVASVTFTLVHHVLSIRRKR